MNLEIDALGRTVVEFCTRIGTDPLLVQGAGGNVSWKAGNALWIKASGKWLVEADNDDIFVPVDLRLLRNALANGDYAVVPQALTDGDLKPSIETLLHALMPQPVVAHLHAIEALAHLVRISGLEEIRRKLDPTIRWVATDYHKPGADLAEAVAQVLVTDRQAPVVFLGNHGVVVGAETVTQLENLLDRITGSLRCPILYTCRSEDEEHPASVAEGNVTGYERINDPVVQSLIFDETLLRRVTEDWALYPDHVVFLGARAIVCDDLATLENLARNANSAPELVFVRKNGVFSHINFSIAKRVQLRCYTDVVVRQGEADTLRSLSHQAVGQLLNWDAERYRMALNK